MPHTSKEEKFEAVFEAVISILNTNGGMSQLTPSNLARTSGVSRPWIYKYVGQSREDFIQRTSEHFLSKLFRPRENRTLHDQKDLRRILREDTVQLIQLAQAHPRLVPLIFSYFDSHGPVGEIVRGGINFQGRQLAPAIEKYLQTSKADAELLGELISVLRLGLAFYLLKETKGKAREPMSIEALTRLYKHFKQLL